MEASGISGTVIGLDDPYGSLITDIQGDDFKKLGYALEDKVTLKIGKKQYSFPYEKTFMGVPVGQPLVYIDSRGRVGVAGSTKVISQRCTRSRRRFPSSFLGRGNRHEVDGAR